MLIPQTFVRFPAPVTLAMPCRPGIRPRVVMPGGVSIDTNETPNALDREFTEFPLVVHVDSLRRYVLAYLSPIPQPVTLYGPADFGPAVADEMEDHAQRVLDLCGDDPAAFLQPYVSGTVEAYYERPDPPARIPREIANWRAKAVLGAINVIPQVEAVINALPEPERSVVLAAWNGDGKLARHSPTVLALAPALGLSPEQLDALFKQADALQV